MPLVYEHGLPDIEHEWKLDGASPARAGKDKDAPLRRCPSCGCINVMSKTCPNCAYEYPVVDRSVMIADGTLILIKETAFAGRREPVSRPTGPVPEGMMTIEQYARPRVQGKQAERTRKMHTPEFRQGRRSVCAS